MSRYALGIDVGATKVAIATVGEDFIVRQKQEVLTNADSGETLWSSIEEVVTKFMKIESGALQGIGVASAKPTHEMKGLLA
jgi:predicted NBD/HSP70 family sugar kinase